MIATLFIFYVEQLYIKINALLLSVYPRYKTANLINAFGISLGQKNTTCSDCTHVGMI